MKASKGLKAADFRTRRHRSRSANTASKVGATGRKRHGSHRSEIIGKYQFKQAPVVSLHQPGIIWNAV
jgi:hypothetical protein